jgi:hypothetical protein
MQIKTIQVSDTVSVEIEKSYQARTFGALRYIVWVQRNNHLWRYIGPCAYKPVADVEAAALRAVKRIEKNPDLLSY